MRRRSPRLRPMGSSTVPPPVMTPDADRHDIRAPWCAPSAAALSEVCASGGARHHQQAAGVLVEPMNQSGARQRRRARIQPQQGILQGMAADSRRPDAPPDPAGLSITNTSRSSWTTPQRDRLRQHLRICGLLGASLARGLGNRPRPDRGACRRCRPTVTAPASIQPLIRVRECCGNRPRQGAIQPLTGQFRRNRQDR